MSFRSLTDHQVLALAIDEWLMGLDDDDWEKALLHIEKRKKQRAMKKEGFSDSHDYRSRPDNLTVKSKNN
jgi:hypothetical protein